VARAISSFMDRVVVEADERLLAEFPRQWSARIEVESPIGKERRLVAHVPGDPQRPFDAAAVQDKFIRFAGPAVGAPAAKELLNRALSLLDGRITPAQLMVDIEAVIATTRDHVP